MHAQLKCDASAYARTEKQTDVKSEIVIQISSSRRLINALLQLECSHEVKTAQSMNMFHNNFRIVFLTVQITARNNLNDVLKLTLVLHVQIYSCQIKFETALMKAKNGKNATLHILKQHFTEDRTVAIHLFVFFPYSQWARNSYIVSVSLYQSIHRSLNTYVLF